ncbi:MAG TPA: phosphodiester glycosidase family protein [Gemmatimonadaceae bacterium]|nr:phosphodiester glycosidase family protein [Gemmatimonadaceae bacterium]
MSAARVRWIAAVALAAGGCAAPVVRPAAPPPLGADSVAVRDVAPGVVHRRLVVNGTPWIVHVVQVDLRDRRLALRAEHARGRLLGLERTSAIARRVAGDSLDVVAAINADFFTRTGETVNNQVVEGRLVTGVGRAAYGARVVRSHFGVTRDGRPLIERFTLHAALHRAAGDSVTLAGINVPPVAHALVLRTWPAPDTLPTDSVGDVRALPLQAVDGDTVRWVALGTPLAAGAARLPRGGALLVARGRATPALERIAAGDTMRVTRALVPSRGPLRSVVGGWPRLLAAGVVVGDTASEGAARGFVEARHPRTAIGVSRDSTTLYLVVVDGRQPRSAGMTIAEIATTMRALGAWDAINLDGGGSTTLVLRDSVVNSPSDAAGERAVGNALLLVRRR